MTVVRMLAGRNQVVTVLREYAMVALLAGLFIGLSVTTPAFLTSFNISNVLDQWAPTLILACGATVVIISGGFDLSAGAVFAAGGIIGAWGANHLGAEGLLLPLVFGAAVGAVNGVIATALRVHSFLVTLATALVIRGIALAIVGGSVEQSQDGLFRSLVRSSIAGVRMPIVIALAAAAVTGLVLRRTVFGEQVVAVGGNLFAARSSGVRVNVVRVAAFSVSGLLAALAGVVAASRYSGGQVSAGDGLEFTAITAVVLGGTSIFGGAGAVWRTIVGVLVLALIGNGVNLSSIDAVYQQVIVGAILLLAITVDARSRRR
jgi:ribose transport system permease protein